MSWKMSCICHSCIWGKSNFRPALKIDQEKTSCRQKIEFLKKKIKKKEKVKMSDEILQIL